MPPSLPVKAAKKMKMTVDDAKAYAAWEVAEDVSKNASWTALNAVEDAFAAIELAKKKQEREELEAFVKEIPSGDLCNVDIEALSNPLAIWWTHHPSQPQTTIVQANSLSEEQRIFIYNIGQLQIYVCKRQCF